jgi:hypothetical protein
MVANNKNPLGAKRTEAETGGFTIESVVTPRAPVVTAAVVPAVELPSVESVMEVSVGVGKGGVRTVAVIPTVS